MITTRSASSSASSKQVGGEQDRHAVGPGRPQQVPDQMPGLRVQPGRRLVQEQQFRPAHQRHGQAQPLHLTTGEPAHRRRGGRPEPQHVQQPVRVVRVGRAPGDQPQHLPGPGGGVRSAGLQHDADPGAQRPAVPPRVEAQHADLAGRRPGEPLAHLDGAGLAGPVGAEQGEQFGPAELEGEPIDGGHAAVAADQVPNLEGGHAGCRWSPGQAIEPVGARRTRPRPATPSARGRRARRPSPGRRPPPPARW